MKNMLKIRKYQLLGVGNTQIGQLQPLSLNFRKSVLFKNVKELSSDRFE